MDPIEVEVRPRSPFRLPRLTGGDRLVKEDGIGFKRLLVTDGVPTLVRVRPYYEGRFLFTAEAIDPARITGPGSEELTEAGETDLLDSITRMRFALGIDLDLAPMRELFGEDPLLGPAIKGLSVGRPHRRPYPWEALLWAITEQLIEYKRAAAIQRNMIRKWGMRLDDPGPCARGFQDVMFTVPSPAVIAGASPAELEGCGLSARRATAMIKVAREVATGRTDLREEVDDRRLLAISEIGPWTIACLGLRGRGDPDALLAGDLSQVKLVGYLDGLGRNAEVEEVEAFYEKYAPYRGLAGEYLVSAQGRPVHGPGSTVRIRMRQNIKRAA